MVQHAYSYMCGFNDAIAEVLTPLLEAQQKHPDAHDALQILIDFVYKLRHDEVTINFHETENGLIPLVKVPYPKTLAEKYLSNIPMPKTTFLEKSQKDSLKSPRLSGGKVCTTC